MKILVAFVALAMIVITLIPMSNAYTVDDWEITALNEPDYEFFTYNGRQGVAIWTTSSNINYILATDPSGVTYIYSNENGNYVATLYEEFPYSSKDSSLIWYNEYTEELCTAFQKSSSYGIIVDSVRTDFSIDASDFNFKLGPNYELHVVYQYTDYEMPDSPTHFKHDCYDDGVWTNDTIATFTSGYGTIFYDLKSDGSPYFCLVEETGDGFNVTCIDGIGGPSFSFNTETLISYGRFFIDYHDEPYFVYPELELNETVTGSLGKVTEDGIEHEVNLYGADSIEIALAIEYDFISDEIGRLHGIYSLYFPSTETYQLRYIMKDGDEITQQVLLQNESKSFNIDLQSMMIGEDSILRAVCLDMDTIVFYLMETQLSFSPPLPSFAWTRASPPTSCYNNTTYSYDFNVNRDSVVFSLDGNATWLSINETTGILSGLATELGVYNINITVAYQTELLYYNYTITVVNEPGRYTLGQQLNQYIYVLLTIVVAMIFLAILLMMDDHRSRW